MAESTKQIQIQTPFSFFRHVSRSTAISFQVNYCKWQITTHFILFNKQHIVVFVIVMPSFYRMNIFACALFVLLLFPSHHHSPTRAFHAGVPVIWELWRCGWTTTVTSAQFMSIIHVQDRTKPSKSRHGRLIQYNLKMVMAKVRISKSSNFKSRSGKPGWHRLCHGGARRGVAEDHYYYYRDDDPTATSLFIPKIHRGINKYSRPGSDSTVSTASCHERHSHDQDIWRSDIIIISPFSLFYEISFWRAVLDRRGPTEEHVS